MKKTVEELKQSARNVKRRIVNLAYIAGNEGAHVGPALSISDIMTVLYGDVMDYRADDPNWEERDRCILSKGHACLGIYAPLIENGILTEEDGKTFNQPHTNLAGHPSGIGVSGIEHPAGSLGHGLSVGCGMALAGKVNKQSYKTYVIIGDGESEEGSIWEAAMFAKKYKLGNLVAIIDVNGFQYGGTTTDIMDLDPIEERWRAFGWNVITVDGNDVAQLQKVLDKKNLKSDQPTCVVAYTVKGSGLSFAENNNEWHHNKVDHATLEQALKELA
ncbi:MAG: transketolase [Candidatus Choladocola sp.]|nr:transketolase [Candidatus Choladocola sp.]